MAAIPNIRFNLENGYLYGVKPTQDPLWAWATKVHKLLNEQPDALYFALSVHSFLSEHQK